MGSLKSDNLEFSEEKKIKDLIKKHSEFISFPIELNVEKTTEKEISDDEDDEKRKRTKRRKMRKRRKVKNQKLRKRRKRTRRKRRRRLSKKFLTNSNKSTRTSQSG